MRIETDSDVCVSAGMCVLSHPDFFDQSERDGTVVALRADVPPHLTQALREAAERCPSGALRLAD